MTHNERIKHEFLLLTIKLGEDNAQFFHCDLCPDPMPEVYNIMLDVMFWQGLDDRAIAANTDNVKAYVAGLYLDLCKNAKFKMETLIQLLETEKSDAEAKNIKDTHTG